MNFAHFIILLVKDQNDKKASDAFKIFVKTAALQELIQGTSNFYWIVPLNFYLLQINAVNYQKIYFLAFTTILFTRMSLKAKNEIHGAMSLVASS